MVYALWLYVILFSQISHVDTMKSECISVKEVATEVGGRQQSMTVDRMLYDI
jgi:hypothetical protein